MNRTLTRLVALAGGLLLLLGGCAPERPDITPSEHSIGGMAILASGTSGGTDILLLDASGHETERIETNLGSWTQGLAYHPDDFFLVGQGEYIYKVEWNGESEPFSQTPMWGGIYGVTAGEEGDVTVGNAEDGVTVLDDEGEEQVHYMMGGTCFMDTAPTVSGAGASIDIYGPRIVLADTESNTLEVIAEPVGSNAGHLAIDDSGRMYAGSYWENSSLWLVDDGDVSSLGSLAGEGLPADWILGMAGAGNSSAYVLYDGSQGAAIAEVHSDGRIDEVIAADAEVWSSLVVF
jgi:hypothetical protein